MEKEKKVKAKKKKHEKNKKEFSKVLLIQESALIWVISLSFIVLAYICVKNAYFGELPWLTAMVGLPWTAYGISQGFYYKKSTKENTKNGIKYESVMTELNARIEQEANASTYNYATFDDLEQKMNEDYEEDQ